MWSSDLHEEIRELFLDAQAPVIEDARLARILHTDWQDGRSANTKAWQSANRERVRKIKQAWYQANRERVRKQKQAWCEANRESVRKASRARYQAKKAIQ